LLHALPTVGSAVEVTARLSVPHAGSSGNLQYSGLRSVVSASTGLAASVVDQSIAHCRRFRAGNPDARAISRRRKSERIPTIPAVYRRRWGTPVACVRTYDTEPY